MQIATRKVQQVLVIDLAGRLDSQTAGDVGDRLMAIATGGDKRVVLNLGGVSFVTSAGLRIVLRLSKLLQSHRGELRISDAQPLVADVLETAGFDSLLRIHASEADAVAGFGAA